MLLPQRAAAGAFFALIAATSLACAAPDPRPDVLRGYEANNACDTNLPDIRKLADCYRDTDAKAHSIAFRAGLYLGASINFDALATVDAAMASGNKLAAMDLVLAKAELKNAYLTLRPLQRQIGLSDAQLIAATPIKPEARALYLAKLRGWKTAFP